jgi:hypothetical protein
VALRDALFQTASIKSVTYGTAGQRVSATLLSDVPTRREYVQRLIVDRNGKDVLSNFLFFFDVADITTELHPSMVIDFNSREFIIIRADLIPALDADHHWEVFAR